MMTYLLSRVMSSLLLNSGEDCVRAAMGLPSAESDFLTGGL